VVVVHREAGLRVIIFRDDHDPPHVHVFGDGETKIELGDNPGEIRIAYSINAKRNEKRRAESAVRANHAVLLERWRELHG
jgi:hypothetical protein